MGHPFHLIRYSFSYEEINKKWNGRVSTSIAAFPFRKQSFDLKNFRFGPISFLIIYLIIIRWKEFVKRFMIILFSFLALSVRHLVTYSKACAAYKLVRFTAGAKCPWFPVVPDDFTRSN